MMFIPREDLNSATLTGAAVLVPENALLVPASHCGLSGVRGALLAMFRRTSTQKSMELGGPAPRMLPRRRTWWRTLAATQPVPRRYNKSGSLREPQNEVRKSAQNRSRRQGPPQFAVAQEAVRRSPTKCPFASRDANRAGASLARGSHLPAQEHCYRVVDQKRNTKDQNEN